MDGKNSFILYCDIGQHLELLSNEDAGLLFKGIVHYAGGSEPPELPPMAAMAFSFIRAQIDRDKEKWNTTREKRRAAGKSGGLKSGESRRRVIEANEANASSSKQSQSNEADNVNVTVPVNGNVPVTVIENRERRADKPPCPRFTPPSEDDVIAFFGEQGSPTLEAKKYYNYYTSNGWRAGKNAMKDWKASARKWILSSGQYSRPQTKQTVPEPATDTIARAAKRLASGDFSNLEDIFV